MTELICRLALQFQPNIGGATIKKLLKHYGSAAAIFAEKDPLRTFGRVIHFPKLTREAVAAAEKEALWMERNHIKLCFYTDADFPRRLKACVDSPYLFYYKGKNIFSGQRMVAVVGTRNISPYGKDITRKIVSELAQYDVCVVSGLASGVDAVAHEQSLDSGLQTVAVMGCGLGTIYPDCNERIAARILEQGSALVSEFTFQTKPDRQNFPKRNRIIAGMSDATIVMETATKGGSIITAHIAHSYNRDVLAVPGNILSPNHTGCHELIRKNIAALVTSGNDIAEIMGWDLQKPKAIQRELFVELNPDEQTITDFIGQNPDIGIDELTAAHSQFTPSKLAAILLQLELKGIIRCNPGKTYHLLLNY